MMHLNKPDLQKQTLRCEFELLANDANTLLITSNPNISNINSHILLKYKTDEKLIDTLNRVTKINLPNGN